MTVLTWEGDGVDGVVIANFVSVAIHTCAGQGTVIVKLGPATVLFPRSSVIARAIRLLVSLTASGEIIVRSLFSHLHLVSGPRARSICSSELNREPGASGFARGVTARVIRIRHSNARLSVPCQCLGVCTAARRRRCRLFARWSFQNAQSDSLAAARRGRWWAAGTEMTRHSRRGGPR